MNWSNETASAIDVNHKKYMEKFEKLEEYNETVKESVNDLVNIIERFDNRFKKIDEWSKDVDESSHNLKRELEQVVTWVEKSVISENNLDRLKITNKPRVRRSLANRTVRTTKRRR